MTVFACAMHWYASAMFVVPTVVVGAWGWWSSRRVSRQVEREDSGSGKGSRKTASSAL